jgi:hypothetical protein
MFHRSYSTIYVRLTRKLINRYANVCNVLKLVGIARLATCFNKVSVPKTSGEVPTYVAKEDRHSLISQWLRDDLGIICRFPHVASLEYNQGKLITMCCLKHSTWQIIQPTFRRFSERTKYKILLLLKDFADERGNVWSLACDPRNHCEINVLLFHLRTTLCTSTYLQISFSIIVCGTM